MLVVETAKALVLNSRNPERIVNHISTAKSLRWKGKNLVALPHREDEVKVLQNLGVKAPAPIKHYYDWPGRFTPFQHQRETAAFMTMNKRCLVLNQIGTGKTQSALWAADYMMKRGLVRRVLVISPLSTLDPVWGDSLYFDLPKCSYSILHGTKQRRLSMVERGDNFMVVNHDGFRIVKDHIDDVDLVIIDEAAIYRNPQTQLFKDLNKWLARRPDIYLWMMTGTPTPNAPTDAFSLGKLVQNRHVAHMTFTSFKMKVMRQVSPFRWIPRPEATDIVNATLTPAIRYSRAECFDLPGKIVQNRHVNMTAVQLKQYEQMRKKLVLMVDDSKVLAQNEAIRIQKLLQIAAGVVYDTDSNHLVLDCKARIKLVKDVVDEAGGKVLIFAPLKGVLKMLEKALSKKYSVARIDGDVSKTKRTEVFSAFQNSSDPQIIVAHPRTMAHGLTLTEASTIMWYSPIYSNELYEQANGRIERIGKKLPSTVVHIYSSALEQEVYQRLHTKQKLQGVLLDLIEKQKL